MEYTVVISAVIQGLATVLLLLITWRYVLLTKRLVDLQVEPRVDISIPEDALDRTNPEGRIVNNSGCEVRGIHLLASVAYRQPNGSHLPIMKCIDSHVWDRKLRPKESIRFEIRKYFDISTEIAAEHHELPIEMELVKKNVFISVSFRRTADEREFCFREHYSVLPHDNGTVTISKAGPRQHIDSLESYVMSR